MAEAKYIINNSEITAVDNATVEWVDDTFFYIFFLGQKYHGEILAANLEENTLTIKINQRTFEVKRKGALDDLIKKMGLDQKKVKKMHQLESPMPGRVISFAVEVGQEVEVGSPLLTLEAMKMENVIKADGVGTVKGLAVNNGDVVDKGQVIIEFE